MTNNEIMKSYLKKIVIAPLLDKGFTGKYPHFRKVDENCIELFTVQVNKWGGSFTIEVSAVFPNGKIKNYTEWEGLTEEQLTVWNTGERYRLKGMYGGWFYYRDLYVKGNGVFGKHYLDISEKKIADFVAPKGYKLVQTFDDEQAVKICNEVNKQLVDAFKWLSKFKKRNI